MNVEKTAAIFLGCSLFAASSGITSAYLKSEPRILSNRVSAGSVYVKLTEPAWDPQKAQDMHPSDAVPKNPTATNTGKSDAWIFLHLSVPVKRISVVDPESRRKLDPSDQELFSFTANGAWELVSQKPAGGTVEYVYGYRELVAPSETTVPLFDEVVLVNYLEGEIGREEELHLTIRAEAIQDHVCPPGADLAEIYTYLPQRDIG